MTYLAYLVRLWQETPDGPWRASAQSVQTGEITRFGSQQTLFAFLETASVVATQANAPPTEKESDQTS
ncbi:MAG: hypothetical protein KDE31_25285 [Caldilineaceae bacterium]|nr:hypothetical protein [Caldilineaceae bacterium]